MKSIKIQLKRFAHQESLAKIIHNNCVSRAKRQKNPGCLLAMLTIRHSQLCGQAGFTLWMRLVLVRTCRILKESDRSDSLASCIVVYISLGVAYLCRQDTRSTQIMERIAHSTLRSNREGERMRECRSARHYEFIHRCAEHSASL